MTQAIQVYKLFIIVSFQIFFGLWLGKYVISVKVEIDKVFCNRIDCVVIIRIKHSIK